MSDLMFEKADSAFSITKPTDEQAILKISRAMASPERIAILKSLLRENKNMITLSQELDIPTSSVARHVEILADAGLIFLNYQPGPKGRTKHCALATLGYSVSLQPPKLAREHGESFSIELPIGMFSHCHIETPCGMLGANKQLFPFDSPSHFFDPERVNAECLWFDRGFISYNFPTPPYELGCQLSELTFTFEICSETNCYNNDWPSDITVFINKKEVLTFTSPGDFGGRRGKYTPEYWPVTSTQFGILKTITVNKTGVFMDNQFVHKNLTIADLLPFNEPYIQFTIGIKDEAVHKGGINLFGKNFGDYPQAIIMTANA